MFSGIVEEIGTVQKLERRKNLAVLTVKALKVMRGVKKGDSIAVDGVCLTVRDKSKGILVFDMMKETLDKTTLNGRCRGDKVNLERALKVNSRINGHMVTGHIDDVGSIKKVKLLANYTEYQIGIKSNLKKFIVSKGSISVDGVSLTVGAVKKDRFSVYLIPFTKKVTALGKKKSQESVNIEVDILARYIVNSR